MRNAKTRTIERKRVKKETNVKTTERSRNKRLGTQVEIVDGNIRAVELDLADFADFDDAVVEYQEIMDSEVVIEEIETKNRSALQRLTDKLKRKILL